MFNKAIIPAGFVAILLLLHSCNGEPEKTERPRIFEGYGLWMDTVLKTQEKVIRGLEPGMSMEEVKKLEGISPLEEDSASLYYEISADSITDVTLSYTFAEKLLNEIEMVIRTKTLDAGTKVLSDLQKYFETKYPGSVMQKGVLVFTGKTFGGEPIKISIEDRSGIDDGEISMLVYKEQ